MEPFKSRWKQSVTPEQAVEILRKYGTEITLEEAEIILNLMYKMSKFNIEQLSNNENSRPLHKSEHR